MSDEKQEAAKSVHQMKIDALESERKYATPVVGPRPPGTPPLRALSRQDHEFNAALDRQIEFWKREAEKAEAVRGHARESFALGKNKDRARTDFNRSAEHGHER